MELFFWEHLDRGKVIHVAQTTGQLAELTRNCLQNPNRGGAWYSPFALHIHCKIIVKYKDGKEIIIIWHAKSVFFFFFFLNFRKHFKRIRKYIRVQLRDKYATSYTVSVQYLIFSEIQMLPLLSGPSINVDTYCQRIYRNRFSNTPSSSLLICYHKHFCRIFVVGRWK